VNPAGVAAPTLARPARLWLAAVGLLTCGAFGAAVALAPSGSADPARGLAWLLFVGSSVHVASTGWLYTVPEVRGYVRDHRARFLWVPLALVAGVAAVATAIPERTFVWLLLPYFAWQFFHFQKQNLGMAALTGSAYGVAPLRPAERWALVASGLAGIAGLIAHPDLLQISIDTRIAALFPVSAIAFVAAAMFGLLQLSRRPADQRPRGFAAVYVVSLLFSLPVFVFASPYAAVGGMTITHGAQYLLLIGLLASAGEAGAPRWLRLTVLFNIALIGGLFLSVASHLHDAAPAGRVIYGAYLGATMAHFVIDAGIWRLREAFPRRFISTRLPFLVPARPEAAVVA
jgi:hypothetical protein